MKKEKDFKRKNIKPLKIFMFNQRKKLIIFFSLWIGVFIFNLSILQARETLNIYTSHGYLPPEIITKFETETGIQILVDFFDSDDVLEAKLLTGVIGYDLVFPTSWPYGMRQAMAGFYQKIDFSKIPNAQKIDPFFRKMLEGKEHVDQYMIPFLWGVVGFAYNISYVEKYQQLSLPVDSWAMFFDPIVVEKMSLCGVVMLDDPVDVIVIAKLYLGIDPTSESKKDLNKVIQLLQKVRPFIKRFDLSRSNDEIVNGEMCLVQHWMGAIARSYDHLEGFRKKSIQAVIPKEGSLGWMDVMAIPSNALRPDLAHKFINFILQPENMALITNETYYANPVPASWDYVNPQIRSNETLFPSLKTLARVIFHKSFSPTYQKMMTRALTKIRSKR